MMTIYEKEALFDQLDEEFSQIKRFVCQAAGQVEVHEVEGKVFRQLQDLGRHFLSRFVQLCGTGYEANGFKEQGKGQKMRYKGCQSVSYLSIFGSIPIRRAAYARADGSYFYPLDEHLNLPAHKYSYLLLKWLAQDAAQHDFRQAVARFNQIFDLSLSASLPQRLGGEIAAYVTPFYDAQPAPDQDLEGSHLAMSADCKGVRILKSERAEGAVGTPACARRRRGEKPSLKKDAVVVTDFSFYPQARTAQEIVKGLLNQFTQKEKDQARKNRQKRTALGLCHPREPIHKHVFATMNGKKEAFEHLIRHVHKRDPTLEKPIIALIDGEPALERRLKECLEAYNMTDQLDAIILDIIHATEYLWDVATCLYGEKNKKRTDWMQDKLYALTSRPVGYLIGALRQMMTKNKIRFSTSQKQVLKKTITYFDNHRHMMDYATYLKKGYPIATGVVEGTCGSLVKDRMEQSGMRWSLSGAQAILAQRAVVKNDDWNAFWNFYIDSEHQRLYPKVGYKTLYQQAA